jgi:hypothetical protein
MKPYLKYSHNAHVLIGKCLILSKIQTSGFIVFAGGRTGSSYLTTLLNSHPQIDCDGEILGTHPLNSIEFITARAFRSSLKKKIFGFKVKHYQIESHKYLNSRCDFLRVNAQKKWKIIYLYRDNMLATIISIIIGLKRRGKWHYDAKKDIINKTYITIDEILFYKNLLIKGRVEEESFLENCKHFIINYENDLLNFNNDKISSLQNFIGVKPCSLQSRLVRTSNLGAAGVVANWEALKSELTPHFPDNWIEVA